MSRTAVIVALLLAVGLGVAALLFSRGNGAPNPTGPLLSFEPSSVTELRMDYPDGSFQAVRRQVADWQVVLGSPGTPERAWPASQTQVHAALRIFANLVPEQPAEGPIPRAAGTLTITSGGATAALKISDQRLGGRVLVQSASQAAWVDAGIADMLITTGIRAWRHIAAIPGVGPEASRIDIKSDTGVPLSLARVQGKWFVREPVAAPADAEAIGRLIATLAAARIEEFSDSGAPSQAGFDSPVATLRVETDARDAAGRSTTIRQSITVGQAADVANRTVHVRLERSGGNDYSQDCIIARADLAAISTDVSHYLLRQPIRAEPTDIGRVTVMALRREGTCREQSLRRTQDGWESRCGGASWVPCTSAEAQSIASLIELLTVTVAERVALHADSEPPDPLASIELSTAGGDPIATLGVSGTGERLSVYLGRVRHDYPKGVARAVTEWLLGR